MCKHSTKFWFNAKKKVFQRFTGCVRINLDFKRLFGVIATTECIPSYVTTSKCLSVYSLLIIVPAEWYINPPARNFRHFLQIENYEFLKK